jgi:quercetin dioxygenase-like cupin family protein
MKIGKITDMTRGWFIGDFEPSLLKTSDFEVGVLTHPRGQIWPAHYHNQATEYNVLIIGSMRLGNIELVAGDTFIIEPNEVADPVFHEDCTIVTVKTPSIIGDKYIV